MEFPAATDLMKAFGFTAHHQQYIAATHRHGDLNYWFLQDLKGVIGYPTGIL